MYWQLSKSGETQAKAAGAKRAGAMGGGRSESWGEERMGRMTGGAVRAAMRRRALCGPWGQVALSIYPNGLQTLGWHPRQSSDAERAARYAFTR